MKKVSKVLSNKTKVVKKNIRVFLVLVLLVSFISSTSIQNNVYANENTELSEVDREQSEQLEEKKEKVLSDEAINEIQNVEEEIEIKEQIPLLSKIPQQNKIPQTTLGGEIANSTITPRATMIINDFIYDDITKTIRGYVGPNVIRLVIPRELVDEWGRRYPVEGITGKQGDFFNYGAVRTLVISDTVVNATNFSLKDMGLTELFCYSNRVVFEPGAFAGNRLRQIAFPNGISQISDYLFANNELSNTMIFSDPAYAFGGRTNIKIGMGAFAYNKFSGNLDLKISDSNPGMPIVTDKIMGLFNTTATEKYIDEYWNYGLFEGNSFSSVRLYTIDNLGPKAFFDNLLQTVVADRMTNIHAAAFANRHKAANTNAIPMEVNVGSVSKIYDAAFYKSGITTSSIQKLMNENVIEIPYAKEPAYSNVSYTYRSRGVFGECWNATGRIVVKNISVVPELFYQCNFTGIVIESMILDYVRPSSELYGLGRGMFSYNGKYSGAVITELNLFGMPVYSDGTSYLYHDMFAYASIEIDRLIIPPQITDIATGVFRTDGLQGWRSQTPVRYYSHLKVNKLIFGNPDTGEVSKLKVIGSGSFGVTSNFGTLAEAEAASSRFTVESIGNTGATFPDTLERIENYWDFVSVYGGQFTRTNNEEVIYPASLKVLGSSQYSKSSVKKITFQHTGNQGLEEIRARVFDEDWSKDVIEIPVKSSVRGGSESFTENILEIGYLTSINHLKLRVVDGTELTNINTFYLNGNSIKSYDVPLKASAIVTGSNYDKLPGSLARAMNGKYYFDIGAFAPLADINRVVLPTNDVDCRFYNDDRTTKIIELDGFPSQYFAYGYRATDSSTATQTFDVRVGFSSPNSSLVKLNSGDHAEFDSIGSEKREAVQLVKWGDKISFPTLKHANKYTFEGWYTSSDFSENTKWDPNTSVNTQYEVALYAKLVSNQNTVTFHSGTKGRFDSLGSDTVTKTVDVYPNNTVRAPEVFYNDLKYVFDGWFTSEEFQENQRFDIDNTDITADMDLYAKYKNNVNFVVRERGELVTEGSGVRETTLLVNDNETVIAPTVFCVLDEYTFGGWYTSPECLESQKFDLERTPITDGITLYAKITNEPPEGSIVDPKETIWAVQIPREIRFRTVSSIFNSDIKLISLTGHEESTRGTFDIYTRSNNGMTMKLEQDDRYKMDYKINVENTSIGVEDGVSETLLTSLTNASSEKRFSAKIVSRMPITGNYSDLLTFVVDKRN